MAIPTISPERTDLGLASPEELAQSHKADSQPVDSLVAEAAQLATTKQHPAWTEGQKILFRIAFVFFISMSLPNNVAWYKEVIALDWLHLHYRDLYDVARFGSGLTIFGNTLFGSTLNGYATWIITLLFATIVGLVWTAVVRLRRKEPRDHTRDAGPLLYYWLRVIVRYRAGIGIIGFGFTKLMPTQLPYPSLGVLNTNFGDLTAQKIYWLSIGIVPWYEVFTGVVEVLAGALLFFRVTTFWGRCSCLGLWPTLSTSILPTMAGYMAIVPTSCC